MLRRTAYAHTNAQMKLINVLLVFAANWLAGCMYMNWCVRVFGPKWLNDLAHKILWANPKPPICFDKLFHLGRLGAIIIMHIRLLRLLPHFSPIYLGVIESLWAYASGLYCRQLTICLLNCDIPDLRNVHTMLGWAFRVRTFLAIVIGSQKRYYFVLNGNNNKNKSVFNFNKLLFI